MMYELMIVASSKGNTDALLTKVKKALGDAKASGVNVERIGKKTLSYPIAKQTDAEYFLINFEAEGGVISEFRQMLQLEQETVLRYLIVKSSRKLKESKVSAVSQVDREKETRPKVTVKTSSTVSTGTNKRVIQRNKKLVTTKETEKRKKSQKKSVKRKAREK